jgi:hypothetical protein
VVLKVEVLGDLFVVFFGFVPFRLGYVPIS